MSCPKNMAGYMSLDWNDRWSRNGFIARTSESVLQYTDADRVIQHLSTSPKGLAPDLFNVSW